MIAAIGDPADSEDPVPRSEHAALMACTIDPEVGGIGCCDFRETRSLRCAKRGAIQSAVLDSAMANADRRVPGVQQLASVSRYSRPHARRKATRCDARSAVHRATCWRRYRQETRCAP